MKKNFVFFVFMFMSNFVYSASVTIYNDNFALVKDTREINVKSGQQTIEIDDVSAKIDPTSVLPKFLSDSDKITILEQNYDFDLVNSSKLLQKYIGNDITVERYLPNSQKEKISGKLLSVQGGTIIKTNNEILSIPKPTTEYDYFREIPSDLDPVFASDLVFSKDPFDENIEN